MITKNRRGFQVPEIIIPEKPEFISQVKDSTPLVYWNSKLTHRGIIGYKTFEHCNRKVHHNSLANLLTYTSFGNETLGWLIDQFKACQNDDERCRINDQAVSMLNQEDYDRYLTQTHQWRHVNAAQSRRIRSLCDKLTYYTQVRKFRSKKSGTHSMRVAFLTLTAPDCAEISQINEAFKHFCDYLSRTANCVYVWKKELGEQSNYLHFHLLINNFIPYYIVSWKWKRLLIAAGVDWPLNENGVHTDSHYRIELPRSAAETAHYVSKYMSKAYDMPGSCGYVSGHSSLLDSLKEVSFVEHELPQSEINEVMKVSRVIRKDYVTIVCCNLLSMKKICPEIHAIFEEQYIRFSNIITLPQRFKFVEQNEVTIRPKQNDNQKTTIKKQQ